MVFIISLLSAISAVTSFPHIYNPYYNYRYNDPYYNSLGNYANNVPNYSPYVPFYNPLFGQRYQHPSYPQQSLYQPPTAFSHHASPPQQPFPDVLPTVNILAEVPYSISNKFTVVPMLVVSQNNMKMVENGEIMSVSKTKPIMTIKGEKNELKQATPAVRIVLDVPILVYSLKTSILFPAEINIVHDTYSIPIRIGAVVAPVNQDTFVSFETPIKVTEVYGIPTKPVTIDYVNNDDAVFVPEIDAVVVESPEGGFDNQPPKNVTVLEFPDKEAEPSLSVDEEDDELGCQILFYDHNRFLCPTKSSMDQVLFEPYLDTEASSYGPRFSNLCPFSVQSTIAYK
ncbi:unnamed protein product [Brassicogethes aeneus]|uniref:Uncharacterized protein n=1 Tax=Brassicogethes aeneus TaxID=1431903 RepID=A0A9P0B7Q7_BRAAE|nr:unnamed protein product [Brassicogethes aeneus]